MLTYKLPSSSSFYLDTFILLSLAERLRRRSREQKVPSSIPRSGISVEVTS